MLRAVSLSNGAFLRLIAGLPSPDAFNISACSMVIDMVSRKGPTRRWPMKLITIAFAGLAMATCARADTITLQNGNQIEGKVTVDGDRVKVQIGEGWVFLPKNQVKLVEKGETPQDLYLQKYGALDPKDVAGRLKLAEWCREKSLDSRSGQLLNEVLALDPNNADARRLLGYVQYQGKWVTVDERNLAMGLVQFEGKWYSPEALTELLRLRAELEATQTQTQAQLPYQYPATGYAYDGSYMPGYPYYYSYYPYYDSWPPFVFFGGRRFSREEWLERERREHRDGRELREGWEHREGMQHSDGAGHHQVAPSHVTVPHSAPAAPAPIHHSFAPAPQPAPSHAGSVWHSGSGGWGGEHRR
jgi:hypothetical protein